ncbi:MAG: CpsD/CapB family tyrosine-protein kinase [Anaerolineae bacterium]|nr:CpsD/CapB family tyrosine-protein kinase [Anaerolineae bacterium]MDW8070021.1 CpsD/CapB family tyrosine-protein kinase [Anaerolineae bacterium]
MDQIITLTAPTSPAAEAYRALCVNLEFAAVDRTLRTLLVTSPSPREDKSLALANLAVALADGERSVIAVDADLRRPRLHLLFGLPNERGLSDLFRGALSATELPLQPIPNTSLKVLTSGPLPSIPSQLLATRRMEEVIALLREQADMVLFDAPPLIVVTDASLLASKVDGVLLVVEAGNTRRDHVRAAKDRLDKVNAWLVGSVLLNAPFDRSFGGYYPNYR